MITVDEHLKLNHYMWQLSPRSGMSLPPPSDESLKPYFIYTVKKHLGTLHLEQWVNYRGQAENKTRNSDPEFDFSINYELDDLLNNFTSTDTLSIRDLLDKFGEQAVEIGYYFFRKKPVYFVRDSGLYFAESYSGDYVYSFWATYPAYPQGW